MSAKSEAYDFEPIFTAAPTNTTIPDQTYTRYRRIYIDPPGMGNSPACGVWDLDNIFERIIYFITIRLGSSGLFLLAGTSCGGYLARAVARHHQERILGLLLRVPLIVPDNKARDLDPFVPIVRNDKFMADVISRVPNDPGVNGQLTILEILKGNIIVQTPEYVSELTRKYEEAFLPAMRAADDSVLDPIRRDPARYRLTVPLEVTVTPPHRESVSLVDTSSPGGDLDSSDKGCDSMPESPFDLFIKQLRPQLVADNWPREKLLPKIGEEWQQLTPELKQRWQAYYNEVLEAYTVETARRLEAGPTSTFSFPAPALIIAGRQDSVVGYRDVLKILRYYPRASFVTLDRADHDLPVGKDQTRAFGDLVVEWLRRVQEYVAVVDQRTESKSG